MAPSLRCVSSPSDQAYDAATIRSVHAFWYTCMGFRGQFSAWPVEGESFVRLERIARGSCALDRNGAIFEYPDEYDRTGESFCPSDVLSSRARVSAIWGDVDALWDSSMFHVRNVACERPSFRTASTSGTVATPLCRRTLSFPLRDL